MSEPEPAVSGMVDLHASALVVGEDGILVRGPSGSGKTGLALAVVAEARRGGRFARIVADDRTRVVPRGGRLVARPHPRAAGLVERRGLGILAVPHEPACVVSLLVDIEVEGWPERIPGPQPRATLAGVALPRLRVAARVPATETATLIFDALAAFTTSG